MQGASEVYRLDDDMAGGDLGDGMGNASEVPSSTRKKSQSVGGVTEALQAAAVWLKSGNHIGESGWTPRLSQERERWRLSQGDSLDDLSKDKLKNRLQEATKVIDSLCCELEVAHHYLEGKYQALKILQGKAILDKATSHTKSLLQKSEARAKALEKEVNSLEWSLSFNQVQMKRTQQSWEQKYTRLMNENKTLTDNVEKGQSVIHHLQAENSALKRQCLDLLSLLNVKEQRTYQGTKPQHSLERDTGVLELAVRGACQCLGGAEACPCSRAAAASRKQLVQLQQELDAQCSQKDEARMVADAFRIAFEQQLRKRSEHFLQLAETNILNSRYCKTEGANWSPLISVSQRLRGFLPSSAEVKMPDDLLETLHRLLDLLNDKEEALAHQRKVSIMLAHSAEELQRKLHLDSSGFCQTPEPAPSQIPSNQYQDLSETQSQSQQTPTDHTQPHPDQLEPGPAAGLSSTQLSESCTPGVTEPTSDPSPDRSSTPQQPVFDPVKEQRDMAVAAVASLGEDI